MHGNFARSSPAVLDYARAAVSFVYEMRRVLPDQETVEASVVRRAARRQRRHGSRARAEEDSIAAKGSDLRLEVPSKFRCRHGRPSAPLLSSHYLSIAKIKLRRGERWERWCAGRRGCPWASPPVPGGVRRRCSRPDLAMASLLSGGRRELVGKGERSVGGV